MSFPVNLYVAKNGQIITAKETDQRYTPVKPKERTYNGEPIEYAGRWYGSQMLYRPCRLALTEASKRAGGDGSTFRLI